ncbi:hypothetical protein [Janibacter terrae]|uniref:hypothetical protein n=1 Tax=Janibacter terrae TaxID=103817 RepID=UPI00146F4598|nr:hypothetical protein [Janibacter terrae]
MTEWPARTGARQEIAYGMKMFAVDYRAGTATFMMPDGEIVLVPFETPKSSGAVTRATFIPADGTLEVSTCGQTFAMELGLGASPSRQPTTVYLDQNHWIDFAKWCNDPGSIPVEKSSFFVELDRAVSDGQVILPLSAAHLVETSKRGGRSRMDLATTLLKYTRGWQLRTVLQLRRGEVRSLFGGAPLARRDAITLDPMAVLDMPGAELPTALPIDLQMLEKRLTWATTLVAILMEEEAAEAAGIAKAAEWAKSFRPFADHMRGNARARPYARDLTRTRFISDLGNDLPAASSESGMTPETFLEWLKNDAESAISAAPGLGRLREVLHMRLMNSDDKWEANDLNDWMYLSYAAAYCDLVVGEKKSINYLRRAERKVPVGAVLHRRAQDALSDLQRLLGSPD